MPPSFFEFRNHLGYTGALRPTKNIHRTTFDRRPVRGYNGLLDTIYRIEAIRPGRELAGKEIEHANGR